MISYHFGEDVIHDYYNQARKLYVDCPDNDLKISVNRTGPCRLYGVAMIGNVCVGYMLCNYMDTDNLLFSVSLVTHPDMRKKGIASVFMHYATKMAEQWGKVLCVQACHPATVKICNKMWFKRLQDPFFKDPEYIYLPKSIRSNYESYTQAVEDITTKIKNYEKAFGRD